MVERVPSSILPSIFFSFARGITPTASTSSHSKRQLERMLTLWQASATAFLDLPKGSKLSSSGSTSMNRTATPNEEG